MTAQVHLRIEACAASIATITSRCGSALDVSDEDALFDTALALWRLADEMEAADELLAPGRRPSGWLRRCAARLEADQARMAARVAAVGDVAAEDAAPARWWDALDGAAAVRRTARAWLAWLEGLRFATPWALRRDRTRIEQRVTEIAGRRP